MLVLSRYIGRGKDRATLLVGEAKITLLSRDRNKIRVGIEAPREVQVYRGEIWPEKGEEDEASSTIPGDLHQTLDAPTDLGARP